MKDTQNKIGYVVKRYPRYSETFIVNEILAHERAGADIEIFALRSPTDTHFQNGISKVRAPVNYLPSQSIKATEFWNKLNGLSEVMPNVWDVLSVARGATVNEVYQAVELARTVRLRGICHLHAHFATSAATVARLASQLAEIDYSVTMHAKDIFHESVDTNDLQNKISDSRCVITVSDFNREYLNSRFRASEKVVRIYNGLDLSEFPFVEPINRPNRIVAVGRLVPKKGFSTLIDACRVLADQHIEFECAIIGSGELESDLRNQIQQLGLEASVNLVGPQPQNAVKQIIASAAVFAAPCIVGDDGNRDGLPTVLIESMALGTPCVSTDVTGIPEIVRHEQTGLIVSQNDKVELAGALDRLLANEVLRSRLANNARRLVEQKFEVNANAAQIRQMFPQPTQNFSAPKSTQLQMVS